jgi:hypothetical protein
MPKRKRPFTPRILKRAFAACLLAAVSAHIAAQQTAAKPTSSPLAGVWTNASRFVEFSADDKLRIVLKPYYGFVYEDTGWIPCSVATAANPSVFDIAVRYAGEKKDQFVPAAVIGDGMYFRFFARYGEPASPSATAPTTPATSTATTTATASTTPATVTAESLDGFWVASGNADELRLYRSDETKEFFSYYFSGSAYYKIRYWLTDARKRDVEANFAGPDGQTIGIPKFIEIGDKLYTCVTSTGTVLRNYETGSWSAKDGSIAFKPSNVAFAGTAAANREPSAIALSADGAVLAFGKPYLSRSAISDLDAEIKAHNGLRRPPRKPVFGYMELDFHWDEIEKIRNNGVAPTTGK